jgi:hypothetical protein
MRFSKVVVVNPPSPPGYVSNKDSMGGFGQMYPIGATLFPPLDMIYLVSYLVDMKLPVEILESLAHELTREQLLARIRASSEGSSSEPILVVVRTSAPTLDWDLSVCRDIKATVGAGCVAIYGSVVAQVMGRIEKETGIDYIIKGDPDGAVEALLTGSVDCEVPGLAYRDGGGWIENPSQPFIKDLDKLPFPKWEMLPYKKYTLPKSSAEGHMAFLPVWSSRGCPIGCHYCPYPLGQGLPWRSRSAQNVVDEVEHLVRDLGIQYVLFRDPMFSLNQKRVLQICDEIVRRGLKFIWRCETRVDFLKEETLRAMAKAGCDGINFGVESSDVDIQSNVGRAPISQEQFKRSFELCRELGIKTFAFFIIGLPGDTLKTVLKTIRFAVEMRPTWVQFTAASPFIGTKLREWAIEQGLIVDDEFAYINSHEVMIGNENLSKEQIRSLYRFARFLQNYLINRKGILKNDNRRWIAYRAMKSATDFGCDLTARVLFASANLWFQRSHSRPTTPIQGTAF